MNPSTNLGAVWVGYLNPTSTLRDVLAHFEHCGPICQAKIVKAVKGIHPYAFIWFDKVHHARRALDMDRTILQGSVIKVRYKRMEFIPGPGAMYIPPPPPKIHLSSLSAPPGASVQIMDPYTNQRMTIMEGSNLAQQISALPPVHIANPEVLLV